MSEKVAVIGSGSWGTALIKVLLDNEERVGWWVRHEEAAAHIRDYHRNPNYLSYLELPSGRLDISTDLETVIRDATHLVFAIPAAFLHDAMKGINPELLKGKTIISAIKGIVPEYHLIVSEYFTNVFGVDPQNIGIIAGPCHSEEVAMERLSFLTIAFRDPVKSSSFSSRLGSRYMKISETNDVMGVEYAAVLKNIMAIANGICIGLGYGDNFQSVLIVNAIREVRAFLDKINIVKRDINDSVYVGDIIVTAYSQFSRNRTFGHLIGKGYSPAFAKIEMKMVAEGYYAVKGIQEIKNKLDLEMPITEAVYHILYDGVSAYTEMKNLAAKLN
jgi:glycerol-3-phosphate dehydrogenase (NAD(P)+)